jgi:hypothetical protein
MAEPSPPAQPGQWWDRLRPYRILAACHYSGAKNKKEKGDLLVTANGLQYKAVLGAKVSIAWLAIHDIEISTESTKRVTVGRALSMGVFALAAKKDETYTYVHSSDPNRVWSFATKAPQGKVLAAMKPVLDAFNRRADSELSVPSTSAAPSSPVASVADELGKLAALRDSGVLTNDEFAAQKARLLGSGGNGGRCDGRASVSRLPLPMISSPRVWSRDLGDGGR